MDPSPENNSWNSDANAGNGSKITLPTEQQIP